MRKRPGLCSEHRNLFLLSLNKVSSCRTHGKLLSVQDFASRVIFVLSFLLTFSEELSQKGSDCSKGSHGVCGATEGKTPVPAHQTPGATGNTSWTEPPASQASTSTSSPVNCIHRIHSCHRKTLLGTVHFPGPNTSTTPSWTLQGRTLLHQPRQGLFRSWEKHNHCYTAAPSLPGALTAFLHSTFNPHHKGRLHLEERASGAPLSA